MIEVLKRKLEEAKEERRVVMAPYNARIKKMESAIKNLEEFDKLSNEINNSEVEGVCGVPSIDEAVVIHEADKADK